MRYILFIVMSLYFQTTFAQSLLKGALDGARPGKENLSLRVDNHKDSLLALPISVMRGAKSGPIFTIVAGIHGFEYPPIIAVQELMKEIDTKQLTGTLIIIPVANTASFYRRSPFVNPIDHKNLNKSFPGKYDGTATERLAHLISQQVIPNSDVFLDIHGGDANEDLLPFVCYYDRRDKAEQTRVAKRLAEASDFEHIVSYPYTISDDEAALYAFKQAVQDGRIALSIECGKLGTVQVSAVKKIKQAVYNCLKEMDMYTDATKSDLTRTKVHYNRQEYISSHGQGIFYSTLLAGDRVTKGQQLGYITDVFGNKLQDVIAEVPGVILYKVGTPPVNKGETLFCIAYSE
ncbi:MULTISPECIES: succinylglutamate desuccinylase/aspartoacylase family protein [Olivibacter]|uniref:Succinylglutamate desuccinylase/aspartoacylase family protein n=1 Tax=Olivibacter oleidegradans TaxID=760123 RepID=A0ABV6HNV7_9SPHI|nr:MULTISPECIES: M14 family metallopeptidase [Olivibacter]MDM8173558.1 M14 family metallopeptidase [Olivibacter sp. 47]QEL03274.1 succinylglutamate desuccinylase [Olivibacter sp. LS-1]